MASLQCYRSVEETCETKNNNNNNSFGHMAEKFLKGNSHHQQQHANSYGHCFDQSTVTKTHSQTLSYTQTQTYPDCTMVKTQCTDQCGTQCHGHNKGHHHSSHGNGGMVSWNGKSDQKNCQSNNNHGNNMVKGHHHSSHGNGGTAYYGKSDSMGHQSSHGNGGMACYGKSDRMGHNSSHGNAMACTERKMKECEYKKNKSHGNKRRDGNRSYSDASSGSDSD